MLTGNGVEQASHTRSFLLLLLVVCTIVAVVQWPCLSAKALCFDDNLYLVENNLVRNPSLASAGQFLAEVLHPSTIGGYYQPLAMISIMVDSAMGGQPYNLYPFHRTSLMIHLFNTVMVATLLYLLFRKPWVACAAALLYGVHPIVVEPLTWVGERKTMLAAMFSLSCLTAYVTYVRKGSSRWFVFCIVLYTLALMSKPTSTPLPAVMLLLDFWPLKRLSWKTVWEKVPFFVIGAISATITIISQATTAGLRTPKTYGSAGRIPLVFAHDIIFYLQNMVWPVGLTPHYAFPEPMSLANPLLVVYSIGSVILIVALVIALKWTKAPLIGWLIFFVMVLPTMQALQFSNVIASDKFAYLPSIGILIIIAWALSHWWGEQGPLLSPRRVSLMLVVLVLAGAEARATRNQFPYWRDSITLFERMAELRPSAISPHHNLAVLYGERGQIDQALKHLQIVLDTTPNDPVATFHMARVLQEKGNIPGALEWYNKALSIDPNDTDTYNAIAFIFTEQGRLDEAVAVYQKALSIRPRSGYLHRGLGMTLLRAGRVQDAIHELTVATQIMPDSASHSNLASVLMMTGDIETALKHLKEAIRLDPTNPEAQYNIGNAYLSQGRAREAIEAYKKAIVQRPEYAMAHGNMAVAMAQSGDLDGALTEFRELVRLMPGDSMAHLNLGRALQDKGLLGDAVKELGEAVRLDPNSINIRCYYADVLAKYGQVDNARAEYKTAAVAEPNNPMVVEGLKRLGEKKD